MSPRLTCTSCGAPIDTQPAKLAAHLAWLLAEPPTNGKPQRSDRELERLLLDAIAVQTLTASELQQEVRRRRSDVRTALRSLERQGLANRNEVARWSPTSHPDPGATT